MKWGLLRRLLRFGNDADSSSNTADYDPEVILRVTGIPTIVGTNVTMHFQIFALMAAQVSESILQNNANGILAAAIWAEFEDTGKVIKTRSGETATPEFDVCISYHEAAHLINSLKNLILSDNSPHIDDLFETKEEFIEWIKLTVL